MSCVLVLWAGAVLLSASTAFVASTVVFATWTTAASSFAATWTHLCQFLSPQREGNNENQESQ